MSVWKNRGFAWGITCIIVAVSLLLGAGSSLGKLRGTADRVFTEGVSAKEPGIQYDLDWLLDLGHNLLVIAERYLPATSPEMSAVEDARAKLQTASGPARKFDGAERLIAASSQLSHQLGKLELEERDAHYVRSLTSDIESRWLIIGRNPYNEQAEGFNRELARFPANVLGAVTRIKPLELFAP